MADREPTLQEMVTDYLQREFNTAELEARSAIDKLTPLAVKKMEYLLLNADSESVQWQISKFILDRKLVDGSDDEIKELLARLTKKEA